MFLHSHPYPPYIPKKSTKLIIGTIPPPRFTIGDLLKEDVDFCYGSKYGLLWPILDSIFNLKLEYINTKRAIKQRKDFLIQNRIGICDLVEYCNRDKLDASDLGMQNIKLRNIIEYLKEYTSVNTILFMGGNSKNGPEYLFRKYLNSYLIPLKRISNSKPRIHQFDLNNRIIKTVSLISPSNAANRSIGANPLFKKLKMENSLFSTLDFRILQYQECFR